MGGSGHRYCPFRGGYAWKWRTVLQGVNDSCALKILIAEIFNRKQNLPDRRQTRRDSVMKK